MYHSTAVWLAFCCEIIRRLMTLRVRHQPCVLALARAWQQDVSAWSRLHQSAQSLSFFALKRPCGCAVQAKRNLCVGSRASECATHWTTSRANVPIGVLFTHMWLCVEMFALRCTMLCTSLRGNGLMHVLCSHCCDHFPWKLSFESVHSMHFHFVWRRFRICAHTLLTSLRGCPCKNFLWRHPQGVHSDELPILRFLCIQIEFTALNFFFVYLCCAAAAHRSGRCNRESDRVCEWATGANRCHVSGEYHPMPVSVVARSGHEGKSHA